MANKLSLFWLELKRRNVIRVVTVYAGAAFVIIELINNITEPLRLPDWTPTLVIVLLAIGFPIVFIFSWIYDIHPEDGMVKTEPAEKAQANYSPRSSNSWKIASYVSFTVILGLILLHIVTRPGPTGKQKVLDKSIAVLPFKSLSNDPELQYQADGVMDAILLHLSKVGELRVMSRTSVEQYRGTTKTATEICNELNVGYLLEGSFQKSGDQIRLIVQLIHSGKEGHVWASNYDREWKDIFAVQSRVAQEVAGELHAVITPDIKLRMEKIPTSNLAAWEFYQRGLEEYWKFWLGNDRGALESSEKLYRYALEYDSTMAEAYAGLAWVYYNKRYRADYFTKDFLDSMLILTESALAYDEQLSDGYVLRGLYYAELGQIELALDEYDKAIDLNANNWMPYFAKTYLYANDNIVNSLANAYKFLSVYKGDLLPGIYRHIGMQYSIAGFREKSKKYWEQALKLDGDSSLYYNRLSGLLLDGNDFKEAIDLSIKAFRYDSTNPSIILRLGDAYTSNHQYESALTYYEKWIDRIENSARLDLNNMHRLGYAYWMNGDLDEAMRYFNRQIEYCNDAIRLGRGYAERLYLYYDLAAVYSFLGERDQAYENLRIFNRKVRMPYWIITMIERDPLMDNIRHEPEFQQIVQDIKAKYQSEHERVRQWLEDNDLL
jgi:TolB-like protein/tetratricopeptide (TPR) repeat protein